LSRVDDHYDALRGSSKFRLAHLVNRETITPFDRSGLAR
jgi:hypothetical protein